MLFELEVRVEARPEAVPELSPEASDLVGASKATRFGQPLIPNSNLAQCLNHSLEN